MDQLRLADPDTLNRASQREALRLLLIPIDIPAQRIHRQQLHSETGLMWLYRNIPLIEPDHPNATICLDLIRLLLKRRQ